MPQRIFQACVLAVTVATVSSQDTCGQFIEIDDEATWLAATQSPTTIAFNDLPVGTIITNQYAAQGAIFTDGTDFVVSGISLPQDGFGLQGATNSSPFNFPGISIDFLAPQFAVAVHYPGTIQFELYSEDKLVYTSGVFGSGFFDQFAGIVSRVPINRVRLFDDLPAGAGVAFIDNLYFAVPAPGASALLALAAFFRSRRRRP
jgi:hypothetical protein